MWLVSSDQTSSRLHNWSGPLSCDTGGTRSMRTAIEKRGRSWRRGGSGITFPRGSSGCGFGRRCLLVGCLLACLSTPSIAATSCQGEQCFVPVLFDGQTADPTVLGMVVSIHNLTTGAAAEACGSVPSPTDPMSLHQSTTCGVVAPEGQVTRVEVWKQTITAVARGPVRSLVTADLDRRAGVPLLDAITLDPVGPVPSPPTLPNELDYILRMRAHGGKWKDVLRQEGTCDFLYRVPAGWREFSVCTAQGEPEQRACLEYLGAWVDGRQFTTPRRFQCEGSEQGVR